MSKSKFQIYVEQLLEGEKENLLQGWVSHIAAPGFNAALVEQFGGEGKGDNIWAVFSVKEDDGQEILYRLRGWYASCDGASLSKVEEVESYQETVTKFREVQS